MELAKNLIYEDADSSRLIYANNPILTCAQLSYLLKQLTNRFRFLQNELEVLSEKLERVSENLQSESRENNLYALYLTTLPTGLTMLDYIIQMGMKGLVETKFTKALVLEFWNDESSVTGTRKNLSYIAYGAKVAKRFGWNIDLKPHLDYNYAFQFGNTMNSPKYMLLMDVFYLLFFYFVFDSYIYNKLHLFELTDRDPSYVSTFDPYFIDFGYTYYGVATVLQIIVMINYWIFFLYRCIHLTTLSIGKAAYKVGYFVTFLSLTITLLTLFIFPSYESQNDNQIFIKSIIVITRTGILFAIFATMLGFQKSGELITILSTVIISLVPILILLNVYILFYSEIMHNFFYDYQLFNSAIESFFSLVEVLFGSLTFPNVGDLQGSVGDYYAININLTYFAFSSNILATFLIIAYLSSILEEVRKDASYQNTLSQYYFLQMFSSTKFKGFYTFPPIISFVTLPFLVFSRIPQLTDRINMFLLTMRFYLVWVPFQLFKFIIQATFYYCPILYFRSIILISMNKMHFDGIRVFHLLLWIVLGPFVMIFYEIVDMIILVKALNKNFEISMPETKILQRSTDDNVIYIHRYGSLKEAINEFIKKYSDQEAIPYNALLAWLMSGGKESKDNQRGMSLRKTRKAREILAELVREHIRRTSGSKWLKNIHAAKKKLFKEILDGFLSYKAMNMRSEDATIDPKLVLDLLSQVDDETVNYLRAKHVSSIQKILLNAQSKEQISIINKIEELDKKVEILGKLWSSQLPKMTKLPSIFQTSQTPTLIKNLNSLT